MVKGRSPKGESFPPSKLNPKPVPSFLRTTVLGEPRGTSTNFKSTKKIVKKNCHSLKVTNIYYLTKGIYCLVDFQGFWEVVHYSSSCMKGNRCGHKSLPRAGWRIGCGTVPWLPYYPDVEPEKNILIFFQKFLFFLDFLTFRMLKASLWVTPLVDLPLMDSTRSPFCILPSRSANVPGMTLCTWKKLNFFYRDALTFHTKLKLNFLSKNSIWPNIYFFMTKLKNKFEFCRAKLFIFIFFLWQKIEFQYSVQSSFQKA